MIKKIVILTLLAAFMFGGAVQAQSDELPDPGILPGNPFYFLKSISEGIGTFLTFGDIKKAERFAFLAEKRLAEADALAEKGDSNRAEKAAEKYQERLAAALDKAEEAKEKGLDVDAILAKVSEATLKHQEVLARVFEKVPEQARKGIERAMEASAKGYERALEAVSKEKKAEVLEQVETTRQEVEQRLEGLRRKGIPIPKVKDKGQIEAEDEMEEAENPSLGVPAPGQQGVKETIVAPQGETMELHMVSGGFFFSPENLTLAKDQPVNITLQNSGAHTFTIDELGVNVPLRGSSATVEFTPTKSGTFEYYCAVPGHRESGMFGSLTVE